MANLCFSSATNTELSIEEQSSSPSASSNEEYEECECLSWRMDATESHSDWTIIIIDLSSNSSTSYHVHRNILSVGHKKSEYFARLFQHIDFGESKTKTSRIELETLAADAFPDMLDYLYCINDHLVISTKTATAMHHLAEYFEAPSLRSAIKKFCNHDMTILTCGTYYEHAKIFRDSKVTKAVVKTCRRHLHLMTPTSHIFLVSDVQLWLAILHKLDRGVVWTSPLITEFCSAHMEELDTETFLQLTHESRLPCIASIDTAWKLLELEPFFIGDNVADATKLTSLQTRCVKVLSEHWKDLKDIPMDRLAKLGPLFLSSLLQGTVGTAKETLVVAEGKLGVSEAKRKHAEAKLKESKKRARRNPALLDYPGGENPFAAHAAALASAAAAVNLDLLQALPGPPLPGSPASSDSGLSDSSGSTAANLRRIHRDRRQHALEIHSDDESASTIGTVRHPEPPPALEALEDVDDSSISTHRGSP